MKQQQFESSVGFFWQVTFGQICHNIIPRNGIRYETEWLAWSEEAMSEMSREDTLKTVPQSLKKLF